MIEALIRITLFMEFLNLSATVVNNVVQGKGITLKGYEPMMLKLIRAGFDTLKMIPKFIIGIVLSIIQIPITLIWSLLPGLDRIISEPKLYKLVS